MTIIWTIALLCIYVGVVVGLTWRGAKKTASFASFAAGNAGLSVTKTALVAAACLTSTATFSINPGFVYSDGLAALLAFSLPVAIGVTLAFTIIGPRLRRTSLAPDGSIRVLTLPHWIGERFSSTKLRTLYAVLTLALFSYAVLVLAGAGYVAAASLNVPFGPACAAIMAFCVLYTAIGGTAAHASTNVLKAGLLLGAAIVLGATAATRLGRVAPEMLTLTRETSTLFQSPFDVLVFPLVIGFGLACQPHILVKALYVDNERDVRRAGFASGALFLVLGSLALLVGFAARVDGVNVAQDKAAATWIAATFPAPVAAVLAVIMIAAAIGTLNALLLALSSVVVNDVIRPVNGLRWVRIATLGIGALVTVVAFDPPKLVWLTGVLGVYALAAAGCPAVVAGCLPRRPHAGWVAAAGVLGPATHVALYATGFSKNPNMTGTAGIAVGFAIVGLGCLLQRAAVQVVKVHQEELAGVSQ